MLINEKIRDKLKEDLKNLYPIIISNSNKPLDRERTIFSSIKDNRSQVQFFTLDEMKDYRNFVDNLFSIVEIKNNFSERFIENNLTDILHELLVVQEGKLASIIDKQIDSLEKQLSENINNEWLVIFPLENIRITYNEMNNTNNSFMIAGSNIFRFTEEEKKKIEKELGLKSIDIENDELYKKICIKTKVFAGDIEKVKENGYSKADESINFLRVFIPTLKVDVEGAISQKVSFMRTINMRTKVIHTLGFHFGEIITNPYYINQDLYDYLDKKGLCILNQIYENNELGTYSEKLKTAIHWFGSAVKDKLDRDKFIKLTICLESLLKKDNEQEEITKTISERLAILLGIDFNHRKNILKDMKELYGIRSAIVHRGKKRIEQDKLNLLIGYVSYCIVKILNKYETGYTFEKMVEDLDDLKFQIDNKLLW